MKPKVSSFNRLMCSIVNKRKKVCIRRLLHRYNVFSNKSENRIERIHFKKAKNTHKTAEIPHSKVSMCKYLKYASHIQKTISNAFDTHKSVEKITTSYIVPVHTYTNS